METNPMPERRLRFAALLAASAALAACSSTSAGGDAGEGKPGDAGGEAAGKDSAEEEMSRGQFYLKLNGLTTQWAAAFAEPGIEARGRARALETAIAREAWERFEPMLADLKESDNPRWRASAARGLGFIANPRVRPALEMSLADPDPAVLAAALASLGRIADSNTDDRQVVKLLTFPDKDVQGGAALCLARIFQTRRQMALAPITPATRIPSIEVDLLTLLLDKEDPILRGNAAQALGPLGSMLAEEMLLNRLRDESVFVRLKVAQALAVCGTPKAIDMLLESLAREEAQNVKIVTALALGSISEREGFSPPYNELKTDAGAWRTWLKR